MKKNIVKMMMLFLMSLYLFSNYTIDAAAADDTTAVYNKLAELRRNTYKDGSKFNETFHGASQCFGFAKKIQYLVFNNVPSWSYNGTPAANLRQIAQLNRGNYGAASIKNFLSKAKPGDIIQADVPNIHTMIFCSNNSNGTFIIWDANSDYRNTIYMRERQYGVWNGGNWDHLTLLRNTNYPQASHNPQGSLDSAWAGKGFVSVGGWAFDKDNYNIQLEIHVYVGGKAGSGAPCYKLKANNKREDVPKVFPGCGAYHGYGGKITVNKYGKQEVYVYAINIGGGTNVKLGHRTVDIQSPDTIPPEISNVKIIEQDSDSYVIQATVTDNVKINRVQFPSCTERNGGDDLVKDWPTNPNVRGTLNGNTVTFRVCRNAHNMEGGKYVTHIYAYDECGNYTMAEVKTVLDLELSPRFTTVYNGHIYALFEEHRSMKGINQICQNYNAHLATITSKEENDAVLSLVKRGYWSEYFLGANDVAEEGKFRWVTGEDFGYTNWAKTNPDNYKGGEDYLSMYKNGVWNDRGEVDCSWSAWNTGFILEVEPDAWQPVKTAVRGSSKYAIYDTPTCWYLAKLYCEKNGGHLATITSKEENDFITSNLGKQLWYYLGGTDVEKEGTFKWITGEPFDNLGWEGGDNKSLDGYSPENYLVLYGDNDRGLKGRWNDLGPYCSKATLGFVCEYGLKSISLAAPEKVEYKAGEKLDLTGMKVYGHFSDGSKQELEGYTVSEFASNTTGTQTIAVSYCGAEAKFNVSVKPNNIKNPEETDTSEEQKPEQKPEDNSNQITDNPPVQNPDTKLDQEIDNNSGQAEEDDDSEQEEDDNSDQDDDGYEEGQELMDVGGRQYTVDINSDGQVTVTFTGMAKSNSKSVAVPAAINDNGKIIPVTAIEAGAFRRMKKLKSVSIGSNVKVIGNNAFESCVALSKVTLGGNVVQIGSDAFKKCLKLKSIVIPKKVSKIGSKAFFGCKNLRKITVRSARLKAVGRQALTGVYKKAVIKVPAKQLKKYTKLFRNKGQKKTVKVKK